MKNQFLFALFTIIIVLLPSSCTKNKDEYETDGLFGFVVVANTDIPVRDAIVIFTDYVVNPGSVGMGSNVEVGRDTTDENGLFMIPEGLRADDAVAIGYDDYFQGPSDYYLVNAYRQRREIMIMELPSRAWLEVLLVDEPPLNPEILLVTAGVDAPWDFDIMYEHIPRYKEVIGGAPYEIPYRYIYDGGVHSDVMHIVVEYPVPFDTTQVYIKY